MLNNTRYVITIFLTHRSEPRHLQLRPTHHGWHTVQAGRLRSAAVHRNVAVTGRLTTQQPHETQLHRSCASTEVGDEAAAAAWYASLPSQTPTDRFVLNNYEVLRRSVPTANKDSTLYRARHKKSNPLGKIRYLWNCSKFFLQINSA